MTKNIWGRKKTKNEQRYLKADSNLPKKICVIYLIKNLLKVMKNAFISS